MTKDEKEPSSKFYHEKGNECLKDGKHLEAVLHYTFAIKLDMRNAELYSNRSLAFLKTDQYHFALEDAQQVIKFKPNWAKGYFRKAEVYFAAQHYSEALDAYKNALQLQPDDSSITSSIKKARMEKHKLEKYEKQLPWLGTAIAIVVGIVAVVFEYTAGKNKLLPHPVLQVLIIICTGVAGYFIACMVRKYTRSYRASLLDQPIDLFGDELEDSTNNDKKHK